MLARRLRFIPCMVALLASGCLRVGPAGPDIVSARSAPSALGQQQQKRLRAAMAKHGADLPRFTADLRISAVGPQGRMRALAQVLLEKPNKARLTLLLPFGPPAWLGVSNGVHLAAWDIPHAKIRRADATRAGLAQLSAVGDVGLAPEEWVALGFGEVSVPPEATLFSLKSPETEAELGAYVWQWTFEGQRRALTMTEEGVPRRFDVLTPQGDHVTLKLKAPDKLGIPGGFALRFEPTGANKRNDLDQVTVVEGTFSDVRIIPPPTANAFVLEHDANF